MASISFWKVLGLIGTISEEITEAMADDEKIDAGEFLEIGLAVANKLEFPVDEGSQQKVEMVLSILEEIPAIIQDNKITATEIINLGKTICDKLGIDLDSEGIEF